MTATAQRVEPVDLFAPSLRRQRVVDWQAPGPVRADGDGNVGAGGDAGDPRRRPAAAADGKADRVSHGGGRTRPVVMELDAEESLENTIGLLHGATAAALLDTAMGCAISTMLPAGQTSVTLDLKLTYLRPLSAKSGTIQAEGKIIKLGRQTSYTEVCARRRRQSCSARDRDLFHDRERQNRNRCSFLRAQLLLYDCKHLIGLPCAIRRNTSRKPTRGS